MREILFRGKRIDNGEWVEGFYIEAIDNNTKMGFIVENDTKIYPRLDYRHKVLDCEIIDVNPATVGQYTGLTDMTGKKIFEGDIVNYNGTYHKVIWEDRNCNARFGIVMDELETWDFSASVPANLMEVIGNIYDNPELLEDKP